VATLQLNPVVRIGAGPIGWVNDDLRHWGAGTLGTVVMDAMAMAGFVGSEMSYTYPQNPADLKAVLSARGLVLAAAYRWVNFANPQTLEVEIAAVKKHIEFCKTAGAEFATVAEGTNSFHWDIRGERQAQAPLDDEAWACLAEGLHACGKYARDLGITLTIHPHGGTAIESEAEIDRLLAITDPELVGLCADSGHVSYGGGDPVVVFRRHASRIRYVHAKDVRADVMALCRAQRFTFKQAILENVFCPPGAGCLDFHGIFAALSEVDYRGWIIVEAEQDPSLYNATEVSRAARAFIREVAGV
jgi:inosose dehydratase